MLTLTPFPQNVREEATPAILLLGMDPMMLHVLREVSYCV